MDPLVSVLIPVHNAQRYLQATLESVMGQTWRRIEIVVVDDGSTDDSLAIAKRIADRNTRVVSTENRGASCARNHALSLAQGEMIQWLDADDLLHPAKIEVQVTRATERCRAGEVYTGSWARFWHYPSTAESHPSGLWRSLDPATWITIKLHDSTWLPNCAWLVPRSVADAAGPWNPLLSLDDDGEYFSRIVRSADWVEFVAGAWSFYRQGIPSSLSRSRSNAALDSLADATILTTRHALALRSDDAMRTACIRYLNEQVQYFYPQRKDLIDRFVEHARSFGGTVATTPHLSLVFRVVVALVGFARASKFKTWLWNVQLRSLGLRERLRRLVRSGGRRPNS